MAHAFRGLEGYLSQRPGYRGARQNLATPVVQEQHSQYQPEATLNRIAGVTAGLPVGQTQGEAGNVAGEHRR